MVKKYRDLTGKYRAFRLQPDALYQSRLIQTLFNKFIKKGKKALSRRHVIEALTRLRYNLRRPRTFNVLVRVLRSLRLQFELVGRRKSTIILNVPTPIRRNKRDIMNIQTFYAATKNRSERELFGRVEQELLDLTLRRTQSTTLRQRNLYLHKIHDERVNMEKRWK